MLSTETMREVEKIAAKLMQEFDQIKGVEGEWPDTALMISDAYDALYELIDQQASITRKVP